MHVVVHSATSNAYLVGNDSSTRNGERLATCEDLLQVRLVEFVHKRNTIRIPAVVEAARRKSRTLRAFNIFDSDTAINMTTLVSKLLINKPHCATSRVAAGLLYGGMKDRAPQVSRPNKPHDVRVTQASTKI